MGREVASLMMGRTVSYARRLGRAILDFRHAAPLRCLLFFRQVKREQLLAENEAKALFPGSNMEDRGMSEFVDEKNRVLIILGSGPSVADLDDVDFTFFSKCFSIGINAWILHPFIPDAYTYEYDEDDRLLGFLGREAVRRAKPKVFLLRPRGKHEYAHYRKLPHFLRQSSIVYGRVNLFTRNTELIWDDFARSMQQLRLLPRARVLPDNGATVARMVSLGVLRGFRRIVLVGVDLVGTDYFWDRDPSLLFYLGISSWGGGQIGPQHETLSDQRRPFPIDVWLYAVAEGLAKRGISLEVWSSESRLAHRLPVSPESRHR